MSKDFVIEGIRNYYLKKEIKELHFDTIVNPYGDTDYIIAALQIINKYKYNEIPYAPQIVFSLQPSIRPIPRGKTVDDGYLYAFVNVGTIGIGQKWCVYYEMLEDWITILSKCSIHVSRLQLVLKDRTNAYNGGGLSIYVDGKEIGQANYYNTSNILSVFDDTYIFDFGFGIERIVWASNTFEDFNYIYQSSEDYFYRRDNISVIVSQTVLMIVSGIMPNSSKYGLKLKELFRKLTDKVHDFDLSVSIKYAYDYWTKFIKTTIDYNRLKEIWNNEMNYLKNDLLSRELDISISNKQLRTSSDLFCDNLLIQGVRRK